MARSIRLGTKLRRAVTVSTAARKLRQTSISDYERKFRVAIQDCKATAALLDKIRDSSIQHLNIYDALSNTVEAWMVHPEKNKKPKKKKSPKKTKGTKGNEESKKSVVSSGAPEEVKPVEELTEIEKISKYVDTSVASYTQEYETNVKTPITEYQKQVTTVLRTMIDKARQSRDHLEHYESKVVALQSQLTKLQNKSKPNAAAIEKCSNKLERNREKLDSAQGEYDHFMVGLAQCSQKLDQMAADIWPFLQSMLSVEKSYTRDQLETVQSKLIGVVIHMTETSTISMPPLTNIMNATMTKVQPSLSFMHSISKEDDTLPLNSIENKPQLEESLEEEVSTPKKDNYSTKELVSNEEVLSDRTLMLPSLEESTVDRLQIVSADCNVEAQEDSRVAGTAKSMAAKSEADTDESVYLVETDTDESVNLVKEDGFGERKPMENDSFTVSKEPKWTKVRKEEQVETEAFVATAAVEEELAKKSKPELETSAGAMPDDENVEPEVATSKLIKEEDISIEKAAPSKAAETAETVVRKEAHVATDADVDTAVPVVIEEMAKSSKPELEPSLAMQYDDEDFVPIVATGASKFTKEVVAPLKAPETMETVVHEQDCERFEI